MEAASPTSYRSTVVEWRAAVDPWGPGWAPFPACSEHVCAFAGTAQVDLCNEPAAARRVVVLHGLRHLIDQRLTGVDEGADDETQM